MKITSIEAIPYTLPTVRPHKLAMATITDHTLVLVRIRDDEGRVSARQRSSRIMVRKHSTASAR
jgi:L-alanine-DL-glutamate epimerase-like enolase superfamily enzyme